MTDKPALDAAYALQSPEDNRRLYAEWAESYDRDFADNMGYVLPIFVADTFVKSSGRTHLGRILDVGAGTGLVGNRLAYHSIHSIDGLDISAEMLAVAFAKGCYKKMIEGNLLERLPIESAKYDGIISAGTFTHGHVGPVALDELLRIAKPGALFCLSINLEHFESAGFKQKLKEIGDDIDNLSLQTVPIYMQGSVGKHANDLCVIVLFHKAPT
jgi:predicted TPR repeat methyltransferase